MRRQTSSAVLLARPDAPPGRIVSAATAAILKTDIVGALVGPKQLHNVQATATDDTGRAWLSACKDTITTLGRAGQR